MNNGYVFTLYPLLIYWDLKNQARATASRTSYESEGTWTSGPVTIYGRHGNISVNGKDSQFLSDNPSGQISDVPVREPKLTKSLCSELEVTVRNPLLAYTCSVDLGVLSRRPFFTNSFWFSPEALTGYGFL